MREKIKSENWALDSNKENMVVFFFFTSVLLPLMGSVCNQVIFELSSSWEEKKTWDNG